MYNFKDYFNFKCKKCGEKIKRPAAILFSPPTRIPDFSDDIVVKYHICCECFLLLLDFIKKN